MIRHCFESVYYLFSLLFIWIFICLFRHFPERHFAVLHFQRPRLKSLLVRAPAYTILTHRLCYFGISDIIHTSLWNIPLTLFNAKAAAMVYAWHWGTRQFNPLMCYCLLVTFGVLACTVHFLAYLQIPQTFGHNPLNDAPISFGDASPTPESPPMFRSR